MIETRKENILKEDVLFYEAISMFLLVNDITGGSIDLEDLFNKTFKR